MKTEEYLEQLEEIIEKSWNLPLSGGRCVVDGEFVHELVENIRESMPGEFSQAKAIVSDRNEILMKAKREAEIIIKNAEEKANMLISRDEVLKNAEAQAAEMMRKVNGEAAEIAAKANAQVAELLARANAQANETVAEANKQANATVAQANRQASELRGAAAAFAEKAFQTLGDALANADRDVKTAYNEYKRSSNK